MNKNSNKITPSSKLQKNNNQEESAVYQLKLCHPMKRSQYSQSITKPPEGTANYFIPL